ncbi:hypothetical protein B296_00046751 [Ensete ventricosum]|uniref:RING-type E3 ubiquitin transferase n=1 Tax=Ensete ventricosum TaxID=4639 RepID=A0A426YE63_ENSVE|nr:hypothetical protein B296_00046751 [Ensete ventricosum]
MEDIADRPFPSSSSSVDGLLLPPPPPPPPPSLATGASSVARYDGDDDDDEEGDVCRICRNPGDADNPLRYPCACSGSIKFVHQDCLLQWLSHSNARQCEVGTLCCLDSTIFSVLGFSCFVFFGGKLGFGRLFLIQRGFGRDRDSHSNACQSGVGSL